MSQQFSPEAGITEDRPDHRADETGNLWMAWYKDDNFKGELTRIGKHIKSAVEGGYQLPPADSYAPVQAPASKN